MAYDSDFIYLNSVRSDIQNQIDNINNIITNNISGQAQYDVAKFWSFSSDGYAGTPISLDASSYTSFDISLMGNAYINTPSGLVDSQSINIMVTQIAPPYNYDVNFSNDYIFPGNRQTTPSSGAGSATIYTAIKSGNNYFITGISGFTSLISAGPTIHPETQIITLTQSLTGGVPFADYWSQYSDLGYPVALNVVGGGYPPATTTYDSVANTTTILWQTNIGLQTIPLKFPGFPQSASVTFSITFSGKDFIPQMSMQATYIAALYYIVYYPGLPDPSWYACPWSVIYKGYITPSINSKGFIVGNKDKLNFVNSIYSGMPPPATNEGDVMPYLMNINRTDDNNNKIGMTLPSISASMPYLLF